MRCYKCNSVLSENDYCMRCGADVSVYKIVVKASNQYYNLGLAKAQVRDITGAISALKTSLKVNKSNIKARNLLGLCYFEMGEVAIAIKEWVISLNLKPDKNVATVYLKKVKFNPNKLEQLNQAAKKYNFSLEKLKEGGDDVALIQLKKVVGMNPRFVKAHLLLGLLYMKKGDMDKAAKTIRKVILIDRNNTLALRYMDEINKTGIATVDSKDELYYKPKRKGLSGNDVILPPNTYKEPSNGILTVVQILLGVVIGVALVWFLVVPAKVQTVQHNSNETIKKYSEDLSKNSVTITNLEKQLKELKEELDAAKEELGIYTGDSGTTAMYTKLVEAVSAYLKDDFETALLKLADIDVTQLPTETAKNLYTTLDENCNGGADTYFQAGLNAYNRADYVSAITYLKKSVVFDNTKVEPVYYLAMSHLKLSDKESAEEYITIINSQFGGTRFATLIREYLATYEDTKE